jgi:Arc/MetJ-type ribon-helix-helix transcriptional regulator
MKRQPKRKVTFVLEGELADRIREAVDAGRAESQSGLVQEAVGEYLAQQDREALRAAYAEAARDPAFLADIEQVMRDFAPLDEELEIE